MNSTHRNVGLLAACQALLMTNNATLIAINGLAGLALAPRAALATLPVTCWVVGGAIATMPASLHMKRVGRQRGMTLGTLWGIVGALICAAAVWAQSFWLLCFGTLVFGVYNAYGQYYRFAAADVSSVEFRSTAISLVLAGGLVGGILGPTTSRFTVELLQPRFTGAYLALIGFALVTMVVLRFIRIPQLDQKTKAAGGRPLAVIARQPKFVIAVMSGAIGYGVMNFLMTSTPIAMGVCGHPYGDAAFVISSHVIAMFLPSFVTGNLIRRFGVLQVMFVGALLNFAAIGVALSGIAVPQFWLSLVLLGVGWNFLYVGGTALLTQTYRPEEMAKAQGANEQAIFIMMAISSFTSGLTVTTAGWERVNLFALPMVGVVAIAILWYAVAHRNGKSPA
ncbi:MAG: MFS transporter [Betaproteobacteria bacterium]|nr:MFS transporter [Betaproteobacteria bacterium]MDH5221454.1 MFS transporter [Betaproteobacteria bacterium]MDH5351729.1 MFS transporter [Betaproteobacteria bacterium]